jgi:hypothetical protein
MERGGRARALGCWVSIVPTVCATLLALHGLFTPQIADAGKNHAVAPSVFASRIVRLIGENRYADAWVDLHPLHQQAAPLDRYVQCENETPIPGRITSVRALHTWDAPVHVAGITNPILGTKVALRIVFAEASTPTRVVVVKTVGLVQVTDKWVWLLPPARYAAYLAGDCPQ